MTCNWTLEFNDVKQVYQSMRLHFARRPLQCHYVKVMHVTRPSRAVLEGTRDQWISEYGSVPIGNDNGEMQNVWENALDCKPLMTGENLCWTEITSCLNHLGIYIYIDDFFFSDTRTVRVFEDLFVFGSIQVYRPCKSLHT